MKTSYYKQDGTAIVGCVGDGKSGMVSLETDTRLTHIRVVVNMPTRGGTVRIPVAFSETEDPRTSVADSLRCSAMQPRIKQYGVVRLVRWLADSIEAGEAA